MTLRCSEQAIMELRHAMRCQLTSTFEIAVNEELKSCVRHHRVNPSRYRTLLVSLNTRFSLAKSSSSSFLARFIEWLDAPQ